MESTENYLKLYGVTDFYFQNMIHFHTNKKIDMNVCMKAIAASISQLCAFSVYGVSLPISDRDQKKTSKTGLCTQLLWKGYVEVNKILYCTVHLRSITLTYHSVFHIKLILTHYT